MSIVIGFVAGGFVVAIAVFFLFPGKLKSISIGKEGLKIEGRELMTTPEGRSSDPETPIQIPVTGRWLTKTDRPAAKGRLAHASAHFGMDFPLLPP